MTSKRTKVIFEPATDYGEQLRNKLTSVNQSENSTNLFGETAEEREMLDTPTPEYVEKKGMDFSSSPKVSGIPSTLRQGSMTAAKLEVSSLPGLKTGHSRGFKVQSQASAIAEVVVEAKEELVQSVVDKVEESETPAPAPAPAKKPKRVKIADMPIDELYARPKITPAVVSAIMMKEDFSSVKERYCKYICNVPCQIKEPFRVCLNNSETDILIIQDHMPYDEKFKNSEQLYSLHLRQVASMMFGKSDGVSWRFANMMKCRPKVIIERGRVKKLTYTQKSKCSPYLLEEIRQAKPKVIVSTSSDVTKVLGIKKSNYKNRGEIHYTSFEVDGERIPVVLTLHPHVLNMIRQNASGAMYGPDFYGLIRMDFDKALRILNGEFIPVPEEHLRDHVMAVAEVQVEVCRDLESVRHWMDFLKSLPPRTLISWDIESTSLDAWSDDARVLTMQFGYRDTGTGLITAIVIPLWHRDNHYYDPNDAWPLVADILTDPNIKKTGHNVKFDIVFTEVVTGIRIDGIEFDTMLLIHSWNSGIQGNYSLKTAVWDWLPESGLGGYENLLVYRGPDPASVADEDSDEDEEGSE